MARRGDHRLLRILTLIPLGVGLFLVAFAIFGPRGSLPGAVFAAVGAFALALIGWYGLQSWERHEHHDEYQS